MKHIRPLPNYISSFNQLKAVKCKPSAQFDRIVVTFELKTPLHVLGEQNGTKIELYRTNAKSQGLVPAHFALIITSVVHVYSKTSISN